MNNGELIAKMVSAGAIIKKVNTMMIYDKVYHKMSYCNPKTLESLSYYWTDADGFEISDERLKNLAEAYMLSEGSDDFRDAEMKRIPEKLT